MLARILVIEDNPTNMELMVYLLGAYGYGLDTADDGSKGIEKVFQSQPDLIICDLEMPGLNGYEVVKGVRCRPETSHIPVIAVTACAMVGDRDKVLAAGFDGYLSKPIYPETFVKLVEAFLPVRLRCPGLPESYEGTTPAAPPPEPMGVAVLVVDDSPVNLSLIRSTLEPSGYTVIATDSVEVALEQARRNAFDLILSDLHMSPESGLGFLQRVKADPKLRSIPFVILTASFTEPGDAIQQRALELGAARFLMRPIAPEQLLLEVAACLANRAS
jgi:two-component system cell cycle response regulator